MSDGAWIWPAEASGKWHWTTDPLSSNTPVLAQCGDIVTPLRVVHPPGNFARDTLLCTRCVMDVIK